jgi:hypothetical protein
MNEKKFQQDFVKTVFLEEDHLPSDIIQNMIPIGKIDNKKVLEVYQTDYKYRMLEAMRSNFESVWMVLGDDEFEKLVFLFIKTNPSSHFDLNHYGDDFPIFLIQQTDLIEEMPFLVSLAEFEIHFWNIFHSENPKKLSMLQFTNEDILQSTFIFSESTKLLKFEYNVFPLFKYKDKTLDIFLQENEPEIVLKESFYFLYKEDFKVICHELTNAQHTFFAHFLNINNKKSLLDVINLSNGITQEEIQDIFKLISCSLLTNLKEI